MLLKPFTYHSPKTTEEAVQLYSSLPDVRLLAGGTFLITNLKQLKKRNLKTPQNIISLRYIDKLSGISCRGEKVIIKTMTTHNDICHSTFIKENLPILKLVCKNIATNPVRNMGTIGGNLTCRYTWTELGTVLITLDAKMHFLKTQGQEDVISVEDFFRNNAKSQKILSHISIKVKKGYSLTYQRVRKSLTVDIPLFSVCIGAQVQNRRFSEAHVVINNGISFAQRDPRLEKFLNTTKAIQGVEEEALEHLETDLYDTRSDDYKKSAFRTSIKNAIKELLK